jgi:transcription-repair coupling factor (superfamily II helicase)
MGRDTGAAQARSRQGFQLRSTDPEREDRILVETSGPMGETATRLLRLARGDDQHTWLFVAASERRAVQCASLLRSLAPDLPIVLFPPWDCLPYDRAAPSKLAMGQRMAALDALVGSSPPSRLVVTTVSAILQRVPPRAIWARAQRRLEVGELLPIETFARELEQFGYGLDERIDEPGEAAIRGQVIDLFPAGSADPVRIEHDDGRITALRNFDPVTQMTTADRSDLVLLPVSECVRPQDLPDAVERFSGIEHWLPDLYPTLETLFDYLPHATLVLDTRTEERTQTFRAQIADAYESRIKLKPERSSGRRPVEPHRLYVDEEEWLQHLQARSVIAFRDADGATTIPNFAEQSRPFDKLTAFVRDELESGDRVVLTAATEGDLRLISRPVWRALDRPARRAGDWAEVEASDPGSLMTLRADFDAGFKDVDTGTCVIAAADVIGSRARAVASERSVPAELGGTEIEFRLGDAVIHTEHGLGLLAGLETVETDGAATDLVRLTYADGATLMVPIEELDQIWRYGTAAEGVSLDRLESDAWAKRKAKVDAEVAETARRLVAMVRDRKAATVERLVPPRHAYERFVAGFPFVETPDQVAAVEDALKDLASGHPMNRLVCGDVGFGKTEIALRAAAAAVLAGKQVAVVAPTTVLVRQHLHTFQKRFAAVGIEVAQLSRLVKPAEAREVKRRLANGDLRVVIGTHVLAGKGVRFADLALVIVDEEQRFGTAHKTKLRALGQETHVLTMTATPIPRTLQSALVGLQEISIIATPPARRQPIRTFVTAFDEATVREALMRERRRGGQSFVVCPRVEDIEPMAARLARLVPELETFVAHGQMPPETIDDAMVRFSEGEGDVLLATNIIESGLDVPRANTMLVWHADRFGLAQLHQLRGRVGRGRLRGVAYLMTDPQQKLARSTRKRLETLESLDRLGAGFAISARDLDQRGAGDLLGEEQAGHVKLIGVGLYQHLLRKALDLSQGRTPEDDSAPELNIGIRGFIPSDYVPEPEVRINLYARLARLTEDEALDAFEDEVENRFGTRPEPFDALLATQRIKQQCRRFGMARFDAGPQAVAFTVRPDPATLELVDKAIGRSQGALDWRNERVVWSKSSADEEERLANVTKLFRFLAQVERSS